MNEATQKYNFGFDVSAPFAKKNSLEEEEKAQQLIQDYNYLFGLRGNWNNHWTEIAQRIWPQHAYLFQNLSQLTQQGDKRNFEIYDSTGLLALQRFAAILDSLLTPRNQYWHQLVPDDPLLMRDKATRIWFEKANQVLFDQRYNPHTNFASQNQLQYKSLGAYGTGSMFIDDLAGYKGLRYKNIHLAETYLQENHQGIIDRACRAFILTARQALQKFGKDRVSQDIADSAATQPDRPYYFIHWVMPREDRDPFRKDFKGMEYASYYVAIQGNKILAEGGYRTFPYAISRYEQAPNEAYGRSPAMDVLPAIKTLNEEKKVMLKAGHRALDPVLLAHDDGIVDGFSLIPGDINPGGITKDGRMLVQALPVGNIPEGKELMEDERKLINDTFLVNLFQILIETPEMTATEVMERTREKGILLAPTIGRQQSEYLGPMIDRELDILSRQGLIPSQPRLLKSAKGQYKVVYDSPISRAQKAERVSGAMRTLEAFSTYAQATGDPQVLDTINMNVAGPQIAEAYGVPASWMNTPEEVMAIREKRQQMMAQQTAIQAAPALAGLAKAAVGNSR